MGASRSGAEKALDMLRCLPRIALGNVKNSQAPVRVSSTDAAAKLTVVGPKLGAWGVHIRSHSCRSVGFDPVPVAGINGLSRWPFAKMSKKSALGAIDRYGVVPKFSRTSPCHTSLHNHTLTAEN